MIHLWEFGSEKEEVRWSSFTVMSPRFLCLLFFVLIYGFIERGIIHLDRVNDSKIGGEVTGAKWPVTVINIYQKLMSFCIYSIWCPCIKVPSRGWIGGLHTCPLKKCIFLMRWNIRKENGLQIQLSLSCGEERGETGLWTDYKESGPSWMEHWFLFSSTCV